MSSRALLPHARRLAKGLLRVSASLVFASQPQGLWRASPPTWFLLNFAVIIKENPKLWYGIGILYDRYGSLDNAEEAFSSVLRMDKGNTARITRSLQITDRSDSEKISTNPTKSCSVSG